MFRSKYHLNTGQWRKWPIQNFTSVLKNIWIHKNIGLWSKNWYYNVPTLLQCLYVVKLKRFVGLIYVPGTLNIKMIVNVATLVYLKDRMGHEMN